MPKAFFARFAISLVASLLVSGTASAQVDRAVAESLMRKSGMWTQLGSVADQVKAALPAAVGLRGGALDGAEQQRVERVVDAAFAPEKLRVTALAAMTRGIDPAQLKALEAWYDSARGQAVTKAEEASTATTEQDSQKALKAGQALYAKAAPARQALLGRIAVVTRSAEAMTKLSINTALAVQEGASRLGAGAARAPTPAQAKAALEAERPKMQQAFAGMLPALFASAYAAVADADLQAYADFLESAAGKKFTDTGLRAIDQAVTQAGRAFGEGLPAVRNGART